jgi:hypothetical protein
MALQVTIDWSAVRPQSLPPLTEAGRAFVVVHLEIVHELAEALVGQPFERDAFHALVRGCVALREALVRAAADARVPVDQLFGELSAAGLRSLGDGAWFGAHGQRVRTIRDRLSALDGRLFAEWAGGRVMRPGRGFIGYLELQASLDGLLVLLQASWRAGAELDGWRAQVVDAAEEVLSRLEHELTKLPWVARLADIDMAPPQVSWDPPPRTVLQPDDLVRAAKHAFSRGRVPLSREILALGVRWLPEDPALAHLQRLFAPPVVTACPVAQEQVAARQRSQRWLSEHEDEYPGRWVAVLDGQLLGAGGSLREILGRLGLGGFPEGTLVTRVAGG